MGSNLSVYNLGELGVNVDKDFVHLQDGELPTAQNAIQDPLGVVGGITKRLGLAKFNTVAGAGSIGGGIGVPLFHPGTYTIYLGRSDTNGGLGTTQGWWKSADGFVTSSTLTTNPNPPRANEIATFAASAASTLGGSPGAGCVVNNTLFYAASNYVGANPPIRSFDGTTDREVCRIPNNPDTGAARAVGILSMMTANGVIYLSTFDGGTTSADFRGRVFSLSPSTGVLSPIGATFATGQLPYALGISGTTLWVGTHNGDVTSNGTACFFRIGVDAAWTVDKTFTVGNVCSIAAYNGDVYFGHMQTAASFATISKRTPLGVYSTVDTASGGTARSANAYLAMTVFSGSLYAAFWNNDGTAVAKMRKFDGSTWSTAFSAATSGTQKPFNAFFQLNSVLYAAAGGLGVTAGLLSTSDGSSWTDLSSGLTSSTSVPALIGFSS